MACSRAESSRRSWSSASRRSSATLLSYSSVSTADDAHRQSDDSGWNENRQNEEEDPASAPAGIALVHGVILDRKVNGNCHEIVWTGLRYQEPGNEGKVPHLFKFEKCLGRIPRPKGEGLRSMAEETGEERHHDFHGDKYDDNHSRSSMRRAVTMSEICRRCHPGSPVCE
jgi:hypothetical protein